MSRFKVLFVSSAYPSRDHPTQCSYVREHARAVQMFDDVAVLHCAGLHHEPGDSWQLETEGDPAIAVGIPTYRIRYRRAGLRLTTALLFLLSVNRALARMAADGFQPDVVHANFFRCGLPSLLAARWHRVPLVITEHLTHFSRRALSSSDVWQAKLAFRMAGVVMPVCDSLREQIEAHGIRAKFQVVPNAVDTMRFTTTPDDRHEKGRILFVGRLTTNHVKGIPTLLEALASLRRRDWYLDIIGDGNARLEYTNRVAKLKLRDHITFHGSLPSSGVAVLMRRASFLVLPSHVENLPCVALEALSCGLPIVAAAVGALPRLIDGSRGFLFEAGNADQLRDHINRMLDQVCQFDRGELSRWSRERFSFSVVGGQLHRVYEEVLAGEKNS